MGALGTTGAVVLSLFLILRRDKADRAQALRDRREAQARLVSLSRVEQHDDPATGEPIPLSNVIKVSNRSTEAVTNVRIYARLEDSVGGRFLEVEDMKSPPHPILAAGERHAIQQSGRVPWDPETRGLPERRLIGAVVFDDAAGQTWTRWLTNELVAGDVTPNL